MALRKKSQVALEYMLIFSFIMMVTLGIIGVVGQRAVFTQKDNNDKTRNIVKNHVIDYIELAAAADDGYKSSVLLPNQINGINFSLEIVNDVQLKVNFLDGSRSEFLLENASGNFCYGGGWNQPRHLLVVRNINGSVEVSSCDNCTVPFSICKIANETSTCGDLSQGVLDECQNGYCKC